MRVTEISKFYMSAVFLIFLAIPSLSSLSEFSQKLWLSEYGYNQETSEEYQRVSFPLHQNERNFNNSFLSKTDNEVVVHGNLSFIGFTCTAYFPIVWSVNQEIKTISDTRGMRIYEFQSSTNVSNGAPLHYKSVILIDLDKTTYDYGTEEYYLSNYPGKWKLRCHKFNVLEEYCGNSSIDLIIKHDVTKKVSNPDFMDFEEPITIAVMHKEYNGSSDFSGLNLNNVFLHYPNFYADENQQITIGQNVTVNMAEFDDIAVENTEFVEYEVNEEIGEGDTIQVLCFSSKQLYSYGAQVQILWENETETRIEEEIYDFGTRPQIRLSGNSNYSGNLSGEDEISAEEDMLYFLSKEIKVELGMKQVNCYMPIWSTGTWDKVSKEISVVPKLPGTVSTQ